VLRSLVSNALGSFASSVLINSKFQIPNSGMDIDEKIILGYDSEMAGGDASRLVACAFITSAQSF
jgi:tagatose-1,6-bisphosphate aldolase